MAWSNQYVKGALGYSAGGQWPVIILERAKSDAPLTPVFCEVFGFEHESGSVYAQELSLAASLAEWEARVRATGADPADRYFKGKLVISPAVAVGVLGAARN